MDFSKSIAVFMFGVVSSILLGAIFNDFDVSIVGALCYIATIIYTSVNKLVKQWWIYNVVLEILST